MNLDFVSPKDYTILGKLFNGKVNFFFNLKFANFTKTHDRGTPRDLGRGWVKWSFLKLSLTDFTVILPGWLPFTSRSSPPPPPPPDSPHSCILCILLTTCLVCPPHQVVHCSRAGTMQEHPPPNIALGTVALSKDLPVGDKESFEVNSIR